MQTLFNTSSLPLVGMRPAVAMEPNQPKGQFQPKFQQNRAKIPVQPTSLSMKGPLNGGSYRQMTSARDIKMMSFEINRDEAWPFKPSSNQKKMYGPSKPINKIGVQRDIRAYGNLKEINRDVAIPFNPSQNKEYEMIPEDYNIFEAYKK